jgi:hypothetical protein
VLPVNGADGVGTTLRIVVAITVVHRCYRHVPKRAKRESSSTVVAGSTVYSTVPVQLFYSSYVSFMFSKRDPPVRAHIWL